MYENFHFDVISNLLRYKNFLFQGMITFTFDFICNFVKIHNLKILTKQFTVINISFMPAPLISHQSAGSLNFPPFSAHLKKNFKTVKKI